MPSRAAEQRSFSIRPARSADLSFMKGLDRLVEFSPWGDAGFEAVLAPPYRSWVGQLGRRPAAHLVASLVADEAELLRLAVVPDLRRRGLASALLAQCLDHLCAEGSKVCLLEVRAGNEAAIACYRKAGFVLVGRREGYYAARTGREDALMFSIALEKSA